MCARINRSITTSLRGRMRGPSPDGPDSLLHGSRSEPRPSEIAFRMCLAYGLRLVAGPFARREPTRGREIRDLSRTPLYCAHTCETCLLWPPCVSASRVRARRERVCVVVKCSRTGCERAHTTMHPGSRAPELRVDAVRPGPLCPTSAPTNFSLRERVTVTERAPRGKSFTPRGSYDEGEEGGGFPRGRKQ